MKKSLKHADAMAQVVTLLKESFGPGTDFEIIKESANVYRVKASSERDGTIAQGLDKLKADSDVKMINEDDATDYRARAAATDDPMLKAGYLALAEDGWASD